MLSNLDICISCNAIQPPAASKPLVSHLAPLLGTNHVPSDAERCLGEEFLVELSAEITNLEGQLSRLLLFKERLELYRREHRSVLSKFRMLPVDVMTMIFRIYVDLLAHREETASDYLESRFWCSNNRMKFPFILASVCQQWRAIVISTSSLWSNIHLNSHARNFMQLGDPASCLLTRSRQHHLNVDVELSGIYFRTTGAAPPFFDTIRDSSSRWRDARFVFRSDEKEQFQAVTPLRWDLPQLKSLSIGADGVAVVSFHSIHAPKLEKLELCFVYIESHFPWHQLQELSLLHVDTSAAVDCLRSCPSLMHLRCQLHNAGFRSSGKRSLPLVHRNLLTLEAFEGSVHYQKPPDDVLSHLELPALQALTLAIPSLKDHPDKYSIEHHHVTEFISRSQCKLKTLSLECIQMSKMNLASYSSLVPTLTTLKLTENRLCIYNDLLQLLAVVNDDDDDVAVLPQLQHLEYNFHARASRESDYRTILDLLVDIVKARWEMVSETDVVCPLKSIKIRGARPVSELGSFRSYHDLESQRRKGFNLEMQFFEL